jgi:ubiquinone/menaquinone biosynthesis C-methylase UbiE
VDWFRRFISVHRPTETLTPALTRKIRQSFDQSAGDEDRFPSTIDPRIYHVKLLLDHLGDLNGKRVLDSGSGKGRFARILHERYPQAIVCALDLSEAMLRCAPDSLAKCAATMTALPFKSESFHGAYATESLEHAVDIDLAVAEICRVVRPQGRIVIIDKNVDHWGRLQTPSWERWFSRKELERRLAKHCREVSSRPISYWEDVEPDGLFLAWLAVK